MDRKKFISKGILGLGAVVGLPALVASCRKGDNEPSMDPETCHVSPIEVVGPFPIKIPSDLIRENIVGNRTGIPLLINIKVENTKANCQPLAGVLVDVWHCDAHGNYSEYPGQISGDFTGEHFLRGRQTTGSDGVASFLSIYPGWYPGRAPHLHLEILTSSEDSLLVTQTAFPEDVSNEVYATQNYNGDFDTRNDQDFAFSNSLSQNLASSVTGNTTDGFVLNETIKVSY